MRQCVPMSIDFKIVNKTAVITINRQEAMNAIDPETNDMLNEACDTFKNDPDLWVAILTGAGNKAFSTGADLKKMIPYSAERTAVEARESMEKPHAAFGAILRNFTCFKPMRDYLLRTEDAKEGPLAFTEKRKPNFMGR